MANEQLVFKFTIIGDSGVGKTALLIQFADRRFHPEHRITLGADIIIRKINIDGKPITLQLWDTNGQEQFLSITRTYFRGSAGVLLVYNVTSRQSFDKLPYWLNNIREYSNNDNIVIFLIGNKSDLAGQREVTSQEGEIFSRQYGLDGFLETSAKTATNVELAFMNLATEIHNKFEAGILDLNKRISGIAITTSSFSAEKAEFSPKQKRQCCH